MSSQIPLNPPLLKGEAVRQGELYHPIRFFPGEREVFAQKEKLTVSEWAEKYRYISIGGKVRKWQNKISPWNQLVMDTIALPHVREVIICSSPQTIKTESAFNFLGYVSDRDPATCMICMPNQKEAGDMASDRIIPMYEQSPHLRSLISDNPDDTAANKIKLKNGHINYMVWANSAARLASKAIKYFIADEVDKNPFTIKRETSTLYLLRARTTLFSNTYKGIISSTPTTESGQITIELNNADVIYKPHIPCPDCGEFQTMNINQLKWPENETAQEVFRNSSAEYCCFKCGVLWNEYKRLQAIFRGKWRRTKGYDIARPKSVGFHGNAFMSDNYSLSQIAKEYIIAKNDKPALINLHNRYLAEPYIDIQVDRKEANILALKDERPRGLVPKNISCLTASVDTQQRGFYYEVRAWGYGPEMESYQVREGFVETFNGLYKILFEDEYKNVDGVNNIIQLALIDSGGGATDYGSSRTAEVYDFCRRFPGVYPIKGMQRMNQTYRVSQLDNYPGTNKPIPGGLKLYILNTTYFKDALSRKLEINPADPGAWRLHSEATEEYARQMCAEYKNEKGLWQCLKNKPNHYWDVGVYSLAAAEILGVKFWKKSEGERAKTIPQTKTQKQKNKSRRW